MVICPTTITGGPIDVVLEDANGNTYSAKWSKSSFNRGMTGTSITLVASDIKLPEDSHDGISGSADDFISVGGTGSSFD